MCPRGVSVCPQAALPDLNQAFITHRHQLTSAQGWRDPVAIMRSVMALNGCLSEKHKMSFVPWPEYKERVRSTRSVICPHCKEPHSTERPQTVLSQWPAVMRSVLGERESYSVLLCPKTQEKIWLDDPGLDWTISPANILDPNEPAPLPPPHTTMAERVRWGKDFDEWARIIGAIVEDRARLFRATYQGDGNPEDPADPEDGGGGDDA